MLLAMNGGLKMGLCDCRGWRVVGAFVGGGWLRRGAELCPPSFGVREGVWGILDQRQCRDLSLILAVSSTSPYHPQVSTGFVCARGWPLPGWQREDAPGHGRMRRGELGAPAPRRWALHVGQRSTAFSCLLQLRLLFPGPFPKGRSCPGRYREVQSHQRRLFLHRQLFPCRGPALPVFQTARCWCRWCRAAVGSCRALLFVQRRDDQAPAPLPSFPSPIWRPLLAACTSLV